MCVYLKLNMVTVPNIYILFTVYKRSIIGYTFEQEKNYGIKSFVEKTMNIIMQKPKLRSEDGT
jgi:hypothetical protein